MPLFKLATDHHSLGINEAHPVESPRIEILLSKGHSAILELITATTMFHLIVRQGYDTFSNAIAIYPVCIIFHLRALVVIDTQCQQCRHQQSCSCQETQPPPATFMTSPQLVEANTQHIGYRSHKSLLAAILCDIDA